MSETGDSKGAVDAGVHAAAERRPRLIDWILSIGSCLLIIAIAGGLLTWIFANEPEATREGATKKTAMLVSVEAVSVGDYRPAVVATGTVLPAREIMLSPRVSGEVIERAESFIPGGVVKQGELLVRLDPVDYEIAVARHESALQQRQSALSQAKAAVKQAEASSERAASAVRQAKAAVRQAQAEKAIEKGRRAAAKVDLATFEGEIGEAGRALVLREPQEDAVEAGVAVAEAEVDAATGALAATTAQILAAEADVEAAAADVAAAEAMLRQAKLDLTRTTVKAPFDALVVSRDVNVGSQVADGGQLGRLVAVDEYWIEATVPLSTLPMLSFPTDSAGGSGAVVKIRDRAAWAAGVYRDGELLKSIGVLDERTRLARLLVRVTDPLGLADGSQAPALILETFVEARLQGTALAGVVRIDRRHLRDDDVVWVMVDGKLDLRSVQVLFEDPDYAYVKQAGDDGVGLRDGEQIVVSSLSSVVDGAALRLEDESAAE